MKSRRKEAAWIAAVCAVLISAMAIAESQSKYASSATSVAVTFGPGRGRTIVESVFATTDKENGAVRFYARSGNKKSPSAAQVAAGTTVSLASGHTFTNSDAVVIVHASGALDYRTVSSAATTSITLNSATSEALTTAGKIYELSQQGEIVVGFDGAVAGASDTLVATDWVFVTPGDSPLYATLDANSSTACVLLISVDK